MNTRFIFFVLFICSCYSYLYAQEFPTIIPPSPNAASLGQYADVPVSNYTGVPSISVPLYTVKSGEIELPITLNYHASGIKVAQESSLVGLGWSLNAGGVITRQIRGLDDFQNNGYISAEELPPSTSSNLPAWYSSDDPYSENLARDIESGQTDGEPDIFYYNFFGYSGKLVFEKQLGNELTAISLDQNNLIFSYHRVNKLWTVTDGNGWKYYLGTTSLNAVEKTANYSLTSPISIQETDRITSFDGDPDYKDTAWYLTKVETPTGNQMTFIYEEGDYESLGQMSYSELLYSRLELEIIAFNMQSVSTLGLFGRMELYSASQQRYDGVYLKKIEFSNGFIEFAFEDRTDIQTYLPIPLNLKPQRLQNTKLFDLNNNLIKQIDFTYSYFTNSSSNGSNADNNLRLRLDEVQESFLDASNVFVKKPPYTFSYNSIKLPAKNSYSIDHWGYYNGKNNDAIRKYTFRNAETYPVQISDEPVTYTSKMLSPYNEELHNGGDGFINGAIRDVNENLMKAAILESIKYPTGGTEDIEYETNKYRHPSNELFNHQNLYFSAYDYYDYEFPIGENNPLATTEDKETVFTLDGTSVVYLHFNINDLSETGGFFSGSVVGASPSTAVLEHVNGDDIIAIGQNMNFDSEFSFEAYISTVLPSGTYRLKADNGTNEHISIVIDATYRKYELTDKKNGAGLRVKSITTKDNGDVIKKKEYSYENLGLSTGRMLSPIQFVYNETLAQPTATHQTYVGTYVVQSSSSVIPLGHSAQGNIIGYDEVAVLNKDKNNNSLGSSKYYYENVEEVPIEAFVPGVPNFINLGNGQLLKEKYFNNTGDLVKEKTIKYDVNNDTKSSIKGAIMYSFFGADGGFSPRFYNIFSEWNYPVKDSTIVYDINGDNPITTVIDYEYNNPLHKNLTKITTTNSKLESLISTKEYASDYPSDTGMSYSLFNKMIDQNMLNPVIKEETRIGNELLSTQVSSFKNWDVDNDQIPDDILLPEFVKTSKGSIIQNPIKERLIYHDYYDNGNVKEVSKADGTHIYYVWGYNEAYPIAKIENFTSTQAIAIKTSLIDPAISAAESDIDDASEQILRDKLDLIRNSTALSNAMVATYTYDPLIGVTSMTDPKGYTIYYVYDDFNRLEYVKDAAGKILSKNEYHYKTQP